MKTTYAALVSELPADYADLRFERNRKIRIAYEGAELAQVATTFSSGGHARAYANGGRAIASFSDPEHAASSAKSACASASLVGKRRTKEIRLASTPTIVDSFLIVPESDPRSISLREKLQLTDHYNQIVLENPHVITSQAIYDEFTSRRLFINSEGTVIEYELISAGIFGTIVTKKGDVVQRVGYAFGGHTEFAPLLDREHDLKQQIAKAVELLDAAPIQAGTFPVVLDPSEASVFIHEAFGHLSEADIVQNNPSFRAKLQFGAQLGRPILNVTDDGTLPGLPGSYEIDDEGVRAMRTPLIEDGILCGRLHSRETAAEFDEPVSGNMRAVDAKFTPVVRMSNILIEPGNSTLDDMIASIDDGYYLIGAKGGETSGDQFTFGAKWGYKIENGRLGGMVRDINMSGELFSCLQATSMIGNDVQFGERGGCGKGDLSCWQLNRTSGKGSPHIKIDSVTIGGV